MAIRTGFAGLLFGAVLATAGPGPDSEAIVAAVRAGAPGLRPIRLDRGAGTLRAEASQSFTTEALRGVVLDPEPPALGVPKVAYPPEHRDALPGDDRPYAAPGIRPFRLRHFTAEFNYGGWHNLEMIDYASTHGFAAVYPYVMPDTSHLPEGTRLLRWGSFVDWHAFLRDRGIPWGEFEQLAERDVTKELTDSGAPWSPGPKDIAMIDLEHGVPLSVGDLRQQDRYPRTASEAARKSFEDRYYAGYLKTYTAPLEALKHNGFGSVGIYPQPYGSGWFALLAQHDSGASGIPDPATYEPWLRYGRALAAVQDVLYPDVYVYYPTPKNVAYTLARIDFDRALLASLPDAKPLRPYFWPLLHGGDATYRWWNQQPVPSEDMRAMVALALFAGCDGVVLWNWSDTGNHHVPPLLWRGNRTTAAGDLAMEGGVGADVMVGEAFECVPVDAPAGTAPTMFRRYDVLAVTAVDEGAGTVRFRHIPPSRWGDSRREVPGEPEYAMDRAALVARLRPLSEPVAGAVEGLALVRVLEPFLAAGVPHADVPALKQFAEGLPVSRRVTLGAYHLVATYDPARVIGGEARQVVLENFAGVPGRTVELPADGELRVFLLREP